MYPCTECGCCCKRIDKAILNTNFDFPYKWDETGKCEMLSSKNKCLVYKTRPLICSIDKMVNYLNVSKEQFYALNIFSCNKMMDEDNIDLKFRIK